MNCFYYCLVNGSFFLQYFSVKSLGTDMSFLVIVEAITVGPLLNKRH